MLERLSSRHLTEWNLLFVIKAEEADEDPNDETEGLFKGMGENEADDGQDEDDEDGPD